MKRRTISTSKILAVTVVSAACCNGPAGAPATAPANAPANALANAPSATEISAKAAGAPAAPADPALVTLREELLPKSQQEAFAALSHFRPLCDRDGFPLVGNVVRKTPTNYTPSEFCTDLRNRGLR